MYNTSCTCSCTKQCSSSITMMHSNEYFPHDNTFFSSSPTLGLVRVSAFRFFFFLNTKPHVAQAALELNLKQRLFLNSGPPASTPKALRLYHQPQRNMLYSLLHCHTIRSPTTAESKTRCTFLVGLFLFVCMYVCVLCTCICVCICGDTCECAHMRVPSCRGPKVT